jgi:hypothetical protein
MMAGIGQAATAGGRGALMALVTTTTKLQSTDVRWQRQRTTTAGARQRLNKNGKKDKHRWSMAEDNCGFLERMTAEGEFLNPILSPTLMNPAQNLGYFFIFRGVGLGRI